MFREMRRNKQMLSDSESVEILEKGTSGVLAVYGDDSYPYAVPLSYVYKNGKIYFHSATTGHKLDAIRAHHKVSFCVIDQDQVVPEAFTSYFRSVIVFGTCRVIEDHEEKRRSLFELGEKYSPNMEGPLNEEIRKAFERLVMIELNIEHITGKAAKELIK